jgi:hypothetical protein
MNNISDDQNTISEIVELKFVEADTPYDCCCNCYYQGKDCAGVPCTPDSQRKDGKSGYYAEVL